MALGGAIYTSDNLTLASKGIFETQPYWFKKIKFRQCLFNGNDAVNKQWLFPKEAEPTPIPEPEPQPPVVRPVAPEYVAYGGLPAAAAELTRGLSRIISAKVAAGKIFSNNCCGVYDEAYDGSVLRNVWIDARLSKRKYRQAGRHGSRRLGHYRRFRHPGRRT